MWAGERSEGRLEYKRFGRNANRCCKICVLSQLVLEARIVPEMCFVVSRVRGGSMSLGEIIVRCRNGVRMSERLLGSSEGCVSVQSEHSRREERNLVFGDGVV